MAEVVEEKSSSNKVKRKKSRSRVKEEEYEMEETDHLDKKQMAIGTLLFAASKGDGAQVLKLLRSGDVAINDGDYDKRTALHIATCEGHLQIVKSLISSGANVNCADRWGATPLDEATRHGQDEIADYLRENGGSHGSNTDFGIDLINAAGKGDLDTVKRLVKSGISVMSVDYDRRTPLHVAVAERHLDVIQFLLDHGADIEAIDRFGGTPIQEAERVKTRLGDDPVHELLKTKAGIDTSAFSYGHYSSRFRNIFVGFVAFWEVVFGILFAIFMEYDHDNDGRQARILGKETVTELYGFYMDVHVMIFIGFGFLMTFLRKYGYTSVGLNFLLGAFAVQWYLLVGPFFEKAFSGDFTEKISLNIAQLIKADFAAGAVLITFGALLGKTSPVQMMAVALLEVFFYSINETIGLHLKITDLGGSMVIHVFGAYFGLAASIILTPSGAKGNKDNSAVYRSDIFSMIGTIFLWIYWPSFNAAFGIGNTKHRAVVNTVISLCASCVSAFVASQFVRNEKRFNMIDVQNATLAGGVAMGASADLVIHPSVAILIGSFAGFVSVVGFTFVQPFVEKKLGLHDTCGVNNLHGMPGIIGAIAAVIASSVANNDLYGCRDPYLPGATALGCVNFDDPNATTFPSSGQLLDIFPDRLIRTASKQAWMQLAYLVITLGIAISSGLLTGFLLRYLAPPKRYFLDDENWEVPELETPYYFDKRGEIIRDHTHQLEHERDKTPAKVVTAPNPMLESRLNTLEKGMREMAEARLKEGSGGLGGATTVLLLQSLTEKVDKLLSKDVKKE